MKHSLFIIAFLYGTLSFAQTKSTPLLQPLPNMAFKVLRDSCTQLDIVFTAGVGSSMSVEGRNVSMFSTFVDNTTLSKKVEVEKQGFIMWQRNGREFITGDIYLTTDSSGYLHFKYGGNDYFNQLSTQGATFLRRQRK
jgi:hypothetical protein